MNKFLLYCLFGFLLMLTLIACGEDRTYELEEKTERDHWMTDVMKQQYLWGDSIDENKLDWKNYFIEPKSFFAKLTAFAPIADKWSWCSVDTLETDNFQRGYFNHIDSYGLDFILMNDPTGTTSKQYARVRTVVNGSPAYRCGIERGDFIGYVDGNKMSSSYTDLLVNGKERTLIVSKLGVDEELEEYVWISEDTISMEQSEYVEDKPFTVVKTFDVNGNSIAYILCNRLTKGAIEKDSESNDYVAQMDDAMTIVAKAKPKAVILDLRLCNYGHIDMANRLASYLLNPKCEGNIFASLIYNTNRLQDNHFDVLDSYAIQHSIEPEDVFVITSDYTQGAAEWTIRALLWNISEENVFVVGQTTAGQVVITEDYASPYFFTLHPAVAYVANQDGDHDYTDGIDADLQINEMNYVQLYPYGDENEVILQTIIEEIRQMY